MRISMSTSVTHAIALEIQPGNWTVRASSKTGKIQVSGCHLCLDDNTHTFFDAVETKSMSAAGEKQIILGC